MRTIPYRDALREAIREEMRRDARVYILGEDIAGYGGTYAVTKGLFEEFGEQRVRDTPLAEEVIVGTAIGSALGGLRPIAELMTMNFSLLASDLIVNSAAKFRYMFGGQSTMPLVIRMPGGGGAQRGAQHSQFFESWYAHIPGLKVVMPATPIRRQGYAQIGRARRRPGALRRARVALQHQGRGTRGRRRVYGAAGSRRDPPRGARRHAGDLLAYGPHLPAGGRGAGKEGIEAEVLDLRSIRPIDLDLVLDSVRKTNRVVVAEEGWKYFGTGQGIAALIYEYGFDWLDAPIGHVTGKDVPMPYSKVLERAALPSRMR